MPKFIIKRNGDRVPFEAYRIQDAIRKSFESTGEAYDDRIFQSILIHISADEEVTVEGVQDLIEVELFHYNKFAVMRAFINYRFLHKMQRENTAGINTGTTYVDCTQTIAEYVSGSDWRIKANANTGYSNAGMINNTAGKIIANFWLDAIYSPNEGRAHREGDYHIHDLDCLTGYCAGWSLRNLLNEGFNGVRGRINSRPPRHLHSCLNQMANFLGILQSEWAGAQAFSSFDTYLAPYLFKDQLSDNDLKEEIMSFVYNLNVPSRWGQSPFTNITIDWTVPKDLAIQLPMSGDQHLFTNMDNKELLKKAQERDPSITKLSDMKYKHFQDEMNRINKAFYEVMTEGDSTGQPFTFPIPTVNITESFDWNGPNTDILFENTAKIGSSYFQNFIGSQYFINEKGEKELNPNAYRPDAVRSMCCRLQLDLRELLKRGGGLFGSAEMTGSIGVVTLNMARLGYVYRQNKEGLLARLTELMDMAKSTLEKKRVYITTLYERGLYPYTKRYLRGFQNHFSTIGVNGINEMIRNYTNNKESVASDYGVRFAAEILDFMRTKIQSYQEETGHLYNLEATPAEGTTHRFAREDFKRFPDIIQAGIGELRYYTNSSQLPSSFSTDIFQCLKLQNELQCKYTGGTVFHMYIGERLPDAQTCRKLLKKVISEFQMPYITLTPLFSVCEKHGYIPGEHEFCPICDEQILTQSNPIKL